MLNWLELTISGSDNLKNSLLNFTSSTHSKSKEVLRIFWHCAVWQIWLARNKVIFKGEKPTVAETFESVKFNTWTWVRNRNLVNLAYKLADWECFPNLILNLI